MRIAALPLVLLALAGSVLAQQPAPFPPGATLEQKKEIIRHRMAAQRAAYAQQQAAALARKREESEKPKAQPSPAEHMPLIRQWIQVELDTENFKITRAYNRGATTKERYRGAVEISIIYEGKGRWVHREFYVRGGEIIGTEMTHSL